MPLRTPQGHGFRNCFLPAGNYLKHAQSCCLLSNLNMPMLCSVSQADEVSWVKVIWSRIRFMNDLLPFVVKFPFWDKNPRQNFGEFYISIWMDVYWPFTPQWHTHGSESQHCAQWHQSRHVIGITLSLSWKQRENK